MVAPGDERCGCVGQLLAAVPGVAQGLVRHQSLAQGIGAGVVEIQIARRDRIDLAQSLDHLGLARGLDHLARQVQVDLELMAVGAVLERLQGRHVQPLAL